MCQRHRPGRRHAAAALALFAFLAPRAAATNAFDVSPSLSSLSAAPLSGTLADGVDEVTVTVTVRNGAGQPVANQMVRVDSSNPADKVAQPVAPSGADGKVVATVASEEAGTRVLTAVVDPDGLAIQIAQNLEISLDPAPVRPNVIVVLLDDVGTDSLALFDEVNPYQSNLPYQHGQVGNGDVPANGEGTSNLYVNSPSLNQLASEGVTFLNAYAMPLCSPSRATLLTGNYPVRTGMGSICRFDTVVNGTLNEFGDPGFQFPTLPQLTKSVNYDDIIIGKWHLGLPTLEMDPVHGKNYYRAWRTIPENGHFSHWMSVFTNVDTAVEPFPEGTYYYYYFNRNHLSQHDVSADGPETEYATTLQFDEALTWCNSRTKPFLCVVTPNAAHAPWDLLPPSNLVWTGEYLQSPLNAWSGQMAQIEALDTKIGDLWNGLSPAKRAKTTIIIVGDNGIPGICLEHARQTGMVGGVTGSDKNLGATYDFLLDAPENRFKSSVYEKGSRVPMIVAGYGVTNPGRVSKALVDLTDVYPTVAELVGVPLTSSVHGVSMVPVMHAEADYATHQRDYTYTELFRPLGITGPGVQFDSRVIGCSLRIPGQGRFKIVYDQDVEQDRFYKLQDASGAFVDPFETVDLPHGPGDAQFANYQLVLAKMQAIVATGDNTGPLACTSADNFCSAVPNSTGSPAIISIDGSCSITLDNMTLKAQPVPNQFGIFFYSPNQVNGGNGVPYGNGLRCVGGAGSTIIRLPITLATNHILEYQIDYPSLPSNGRIFPASTWNFQAWYRDPNAQGDTFNLSDGIQITFGP